MRELLVADIAENSNRDNPKPMNGADSLKPIAVFAFKNNPLVIGRDHIYQLGDWVRVNQGEEDEQFGFIAAIEFNRIKIEYEGAYSWRFFAKPEGFIGVALSSEVALVWGNEHNLHRLLEATAGLSGLRFISEYDQIDKSTAKVSGLFLAHSPASFLNTLSMSSQVPLEVTDDMVVLQEPKNEGIPVYVKLSKISLRDEELGDLAPDLNRILDYPVVFDEAIRHEKVSIELFNNTWQEILAALELQWHVKTISGEKTLYISRKTHDAL
jgi:hypothetical protein